MAVTAPVIRVLAEADGGRNLWFSVGGRRLSRAALVREIRAGLHPHHHVRVVRGIETPASNPDGRTDNNLG